MGVFEHFPYTNFHDINLDWVVGLIRKLDGNVDSLELWKETHTEDYEVLKNKVDGLVDSLTDIIVPWDSSVAYRIYTIVEYQGDNYIAIQDVPVGAMITNTDYWQLANTTIDQINAISVITSGLRKHIIYTEIQDISDAAAETEDTLVVVNGGDVIMTGEVFPENVDFLFVNGILSGECTINGNIYASRKQIFAPDIILTVSKQTEGYPEWFGGGGAGIQKCYDTFTVTELNGTDYEITDTLTFNKNHKKVCGKVYNSEIASNTNVQGTRLICTFNDAPCIVVGSGTAGVTNTQNWLSDFAITCETPDYDEANSIGISVFRSRACNMQNIMVSDFRVGFSWVDDVLCQAMYCRYLCSKTSGTETVVGFRMTGTVESLYITHCDITFVTPYMQNCTGVYCNVPGGLNDFWVTDTLFTRCYYGIQIIGTGVDLQQDNFIVDNCIDNCAIGVYIANKVKVVVSNNWISCGNAGVSTRGLFLQNAYGAITVSGNHMKSGDDAGSLTSYGMRIDNCRSVHATGNIVQNFSNPYHVTGSECINLADEVLNYLEDRSNNVVVCQNVSHMKIDVGIRGEKTYANGVQISTGCSYITIDPTRIVNSGLSASKVLIMGAAQSNANTFQVLSNNNCIVGAI